MIASELCECNNHTPPLSLRGSLGCQLLWLIVHYFKLTMPCAFVCLPYCCPWCAFDNHFLHFPHGIMHGYWRFLFKLILPCACVCVPYYYPWLLKNWQTGGDCQLWYEVQSWSKVKRNLCWLYSHNPVSIPQYPLGCQSNDGHGVSSPCIEQFCSLIFDCHLLLNVCSVSCEP